MFEVGTMRNNHGDKVIGYKVTSPSKSGGIRVHFSQEGQHPASLERAKQACTQRAATLQIEADRNRSRGC